MLCEGALLGASLDGRLVNLILEHWLNVIKGTETIANLSQFYPHPNNLGYSEILLGDSLLYVPLRLIGSNLFTACNLTFVILHLIGSLALFYFLNHFAKLTNTASFVGVLCFSFSNSYAIHITHHTQMMFISFIPVILCYFGYVHKSTCSDFKRKVLIIFGLALIALTAYSSWYMFYFSILFLLIMLVSYLILNREQLELVKFAKSYYKEALLYLAFFILFLLPLIKLYLPLAFVFGMRSWEEELPHLPGIIDIFNLGEDNLILGNLYTWINPSRPGKSEAQLVFGYSLVFILTLSYFISSYYGKSRNDRFYGNISPKIIGLLTTAFLVSVPLIIEIGTCSPWWLIWKFLPGAGSLRILIRWWFFLTLPSAILFAYLWNDFKFKNSFCQLMLIAAIVITNINMRQLPRNIYAESSDIQPPKHARVIAAYTNNMAADIEEAANLSLYVWAMAEPYGIKTIQGYSGQQPISHNLILKYWNSFMFPISVMRYKSINNIQDDIYLFNVDTQSWGVAPTSFYPVLPDIEHSYSFSQEHWATFLGCFYEPKNWGRWMGFNSAVLFQLPQDLNSDLLLTLKMFSRYQTQIVHVLINNVRVATLKTKPTASSYPLFLPRALATDGRVWVTLYVDPSSSPELQHLNNTTNPVKPLIGLMDLEIKPIAPIQPKKVH